MSVAYFIRRSGDICAVIRLYADNREEVVQDDLSLIEAEILCEAKIADIIGAAAQRVVVPGENGDDTPEFHTARQFVLKL
jgi:hypothetical protein